MAVMYYPKHLMWLGGNDVIHLVLPYSDRTICRIKGTYENQRLRKNRTHVIMDMESDADYQLVNCKKCIDGKNTRPKEMFVDLACANWTRETFKEHRVTYHEREPGYFRYNCACGHSSHVYRDPWLRWRRLDT